MSNVRLIILQCMFDERSYSNIHGYIIYKMTLYGKIYFIYSHWWFSCIKVWISLLNSFFFFNTPNCRLFWKMCFDEIFVVSSTSDSISSPFFCAHLLTYKASQPPSPLHLCFTAAVLLLSFSQVFYLKLPLSNISLLLNSTTSCHNPFFWYCISNDTSLLWYSNISCHLSILLILYLKWHSTTVTLLMSQFTPVIF